MLYVHGILQGHTHRESVSVAKGSTQNDAAMTANTLGGCVFFRLRSVPSVAAPFIHARTHFY